MDVAEEKRPASAPLESPRGQPDAISAGLRDAARTSSPLSDSAYPRGGESPDDVDGGTSKHRAGKGAVAGSVAVASGRRQPRAAGVTTSKYVPPGARSKARTAPVQASQGRRRLSEMASAYADPGAASPEASGLTASMQSGAGEPEGVISRGNSVGQASLGDHEADSAGDFPPQDVGEEGGGTAGASSVHSPVVGARHSVAAVPPLQGIPAGIHDPYAMQGIPMAGGAGSAQQGGIAAGAGYSPAQVPTAFPPQYVAAGPVDQSTAAYSSQPYMPVYPASVGVSGGMGAMGGAAPAMYAAPSHPHPPHGLGYAPVAMPAGAPPVHGMAMAAPGQGPAFVAAPVPAVEGGSMESQPYYQQQQQQANPISGSGSGWSPRGGESAGRSKGGSPRRGNTSPKGRKQQQHNAPPAPSSSLFVGDFPRDVTSELLMEWFGPLGATEAVVQVDRNTGRSRGYGFVRFDTVEQATAARLAMDGRAVGTKDEGEAEGDPPSIRVRYATPKSSTRRLGSSAEDPGLAPQPGVQAATLQGGHAGTGAGGMGGAHMGYQGTPQTAVASPAESVIEALREVPGANQASPPPDPSQGNTTVFVGGLSDRTTAEDLHLLFTQCGPVSHANVLDGKHCGFVEFQFKQNAATAIHSLHGTELHGQTLRLDWGKGGERRAMNQAHQMATLYGMPLGMGGMPMSMGMPMGLGGMGMGGMGGLGMGMPMAMGMPVMPPVGTTMGSAGGAATSAGIGPALAGGSMGSMGSADGYLPPVYSPGAGSATMPLQWGTAPYQSFAPVGGIQSSGAGAPVSTSTVFAPVVGVAQGASTVISPGADPTGAAKSVTESSKDGQ